MPNMPNFELWAAFENNKNSRDKRVPRVPFAAVQSKRHAIFNQLTLDIQSVVLCP
jgi:hypothetical protein